VSGRSVDQARARLAHAVRSKRGLFRRAVRQAKDGESISANSRILAVGILARFGRKAALNNIAREAPGVSRRICKPVVPASPSMTTDRCHDCLDRQEQSKPHKARRRGAAQRRAPVRERLTSSVACGFHRDHSLQNAANAARGQERVPRQTIKNARATLFVGDCDNVDRPDQRHRIAHRHRIREFEGARFRVQC